MVALVSAIVFCTSIISSHALNCKVEGGPSEAELKTVYMNCLKRQDGKNSSEISARGSWGDRRTNQENRWSKGRNDRIDVERDDASLSSDEYGREMSRYDNYNKHRSSTQPSRRYKRERRIEGNSGHRSQYNPNTSQRRSEDDDVYRRNDRNSSDNITRDEGNKKSCALHCFLEELDMTAEDGMPDRYLVTNVLAKNVKNEDLKDFLQESIEECFQIIYNENIQNKCEFSRNLVICISEKAAANCDDLKDAIQF